MFIHALHSISSEAVGGPRSEVKLNTGVFLKIPLPVGDLLETKANPFNLLLKLIICSARLCCSLCGGRHRTHRTDGKWARTRRDFASRSPPTSDSQPRSGDTCLGVGADNGVRGSKQPCLWAPPSTLAPELPDQARTSDPELAEGGRAIPPPVPTGQAR